MCGIAGWLLNQPPEQHGVLDAMTNALTHRGPDAYGTWAEGAVAFGHRRLAVVDIGDHANQPMVDVDNRIVVTYNGEIYNHRELRTQLEQQGHRFRTRCDTEVILEAYKHWGIDFLQRLNGMFAIALWDCGQGTLMLARDRAGEKPLFYADVDGGVVFASEPRALHQFPGMAREPHPARLAQYLVAGYVSGPHTLSRDIRRVPPGSYMVFRLGRTPISRTYWSLAEAYYKPKQYQTEDEAAAALSELIDDATKIRLVADVPLGAFLSSGIDSSTIVASMLQATPVVNTFSVGFSQPDFDELGPAKQTASALGTIHRDQCVTAQTEDMIAAISHASDDPLADNSAVPTWYLSRFTRQHVTVALSGDGGDELFAGYDTYVADRIARWLKFTPSIALSAFAGLADRLLPVNFSKVGWPEKSRRLLNGLSRGWPRAHFSWRDVFTPGELAMLIQPEWRLAVMESDYYSASQEAYAAVATAHPLNQALYVDFTTWMADSVLTKVDRMSMAHGLEVRAPLLDHRIVEMAASFPASWKLRGVQGKYILRKSQQQRLPDATLSRRKLGFNAPMSQWIRGPLRGFSEACLKSTALDRWVLRSEVDRLWTEHLSAKRDNGYKLYCLICFSLWLDRD